MNLFNRPTVQLISTGAVHFKYALQDEAQSIYQKLLEIIRIAPLRNMLMPNDKGKLSVAMTNCGSLGWYSDFTGYHYYTQDPISQNPWPAIPTDWLKLAQCFAKQAGFANFLPNACLINQYAVGSQLGLHKDQDELDFSQPIVSFSIGLPCIFTLGGNSRNDAKQDILLEHTDIFVFGGKARLYYHGVKRITAGTHPLTGSYRWNLTFRQIPI